MFRYGQKNNNRLNLQYRVRIKSESKSSSVVYGRISFFKKAKFTIIIAVKKNVLSLTDICQTHSITHVLPMSMQHSEEVLHFLYNYLPCHPSSNSTGKRVGGTNWHHETTHPAEDSMCVSGTWFHLVSGFHIFHSGKYFHSSLLI